jgi:succinyl-diaminopimelate desuccinylase
VTPAELEVLKQVTRLTDEMVVFTQDLVRIPTVNPPGECYAQCAELVGNKLRELGYAVESFAAEGLPEHTATYPRINVVGSRTTGQGATLHFNGHYDVVPPGSGWSVDPFGAEVRDGRIYGRGTCDQKAGIAASLFAVEAIHRAGIRLAGTIEQSATADEESGGFAGLAWLCDAGRLSRARQDYVVITEQMARLVQVFEDQLKPALRQRTSLAPVEPEQARWPSINLNSIHGGQALGGWQTPAVPDRCTAIFDRRFLHEESFDDVRAEIVRLLDAQGVAYQLRDLMRVDPLFGRADDELAATTGRAISDALELAPSFIVSPGTYDQKHVVRRAGIEQCIAYGPGRLILAHQPDEHVAIADLVASAKVMALLALRLLS